MNEKTLRSATVAGLILLACGSLATAGTLEDGIALFDRGKYAEAEAALRGASGAEAQAYLAGSLAKQKKYGPAEAPARAALEANPTHEVAVAALGESLVGQKKYDDAISRMSAALEKNDGLAYAHFWRGSAYDKKNQAARMVSDFEAFLRLAPKAPEAPTVQAVLAALR